MLQCVKEVYRNFNHNFFKSILPEIEFKIDVSKKHIAKYSGNEIIFGSNCVSLTKKDICASILHEMIHIYNELIQVDDVNENQYHNSAFLKEAVRVGFFVVREKNQGWSSTLLSARPDVSEKNYKFDQSRNNNLIDIINSIEIDEKILQNHDEKMRELISNLKPSKAFFLKYECACPPPYNSIRSGRRPNGNNSPTITCEKCNTRFTCVSPLDD